MKAAFHEVAVTFMTQKQETNAKTFSASDSKATKVPWSLENLIENSKDGMSVTYYKYLEKWLTLRTTALVLNQRVEKVLAKMAPKVAKVNEISPEAKISLPSNPEFPVYTLIDTHEKLGKFLGALQTVPRNGETNLFCHPVHHKNSMNPSVSLLAIYIDTKQTTYILDVAKLGQAAFHIVGNGENGISLCQVLEDLLRPKVFTSTKTATISSHRYNQVLMQAFIDADALSMISGSFAKGAQICDSSRWLYLAQRKYERAGDEVSADKQEEDLIALGSAAGNVMALIPNFIEATVNMRHSQKIDALYESVKRGGLSTIDKN